MANKLAMAATDVMDDNNNIALLTSVVGKFDIENNSGMEAL